MHERRSTPASPGRTVYSIQRSLIQEIIQQKASCIERYTAPVPRIESHTPRALQLIQRYTASYRVIQRCIYYIQLNSLYACTVYASAIHVIHLVRVVLQLAVHSSSYYYYYSAINHPLGSASPVPYWNRYTPLKPCSPLLKSLLRLFWHVMYRGVHIKTKTINVHK